MTPSTKPLPIDALLPDIRQQLASHGSLVVQAAPGAGKTTRVPPSLLQEPWLQGRKLVMLEPRRLAARAAARFMAAERGESVGTTVGYRVRMDTRVSAATRIEIVTEGVLTRLIQDDPALSDYAAVIFDEFHERSLHADLALALCLESRAALRPDLKLVVMSATLDSAPVAALLGNAPVVSSAGREFPVETRYFPAQSQAPVTTQILSLIQAAVRSERGSVLVFLPGVGEIRRVQEQLESRLPPDVQIAPLYGDLDAAAQDRAIEPAPTGRRKVVLATSIAETSLTIEGIRVVVDSGRMRVPRFDPVSGLTRLETVRVSRASADQRRGRAGRLEPGVCYRLGSEAEQERLAPSTPPEILSADLAELVLELARWGATDPGTLRWLDPPPAAAWNQARELLQELGAVDKQGRITAHGSELLRLPLHPRLGHMLLAGKSLGWGPLACDVAVLLSEKDPARDNSRDAGADLHVRLELMRSNGAEAQRRTRMLRALAADLRRNLNLPASDVREGEEGVLVALAYPDRMAQRRPGGQPRYLLANGRGALLSEGDALRNSSWLAVAQLGSEIREARIFLAAALTQAQVERHFAALIDEQESVSWDDANGAVLARRQRKLGAIVLADLPAEELSPEVVVQGLLAGIRQKGIGALPWTDGARSLQARVLFLRRILGPEWPDVSDAVLSASLEEWLGPYLAGMSRLSHLERLSLDEILLDRLDHQQRRQLAEFAPTHIAVPSGSQVRVDYDAGDVPVLKVRLQELFGLKDTPRLARGKVPLMLHLLSPAQRPVQVTQDLAGFWQRTWPEVKKELKGRYPKHYWPDDPLTAVATRKVRPRR